MPKKLIAIALLLTIVFTGCTLQKRTYRKGYYVEWNSTKNRNSTKESKTSEITPLTGISSKQFNEPISASLNDKLILSPKKIPADSIKEICNDSIWTKEGSVSRVKILEVTESEIKFKRCANINGPTIVVTPYSISKIKYSNGMVEYYRDAKKIEPVKKERVASKSNENAYDIGNIAGVFGLLFIACGILAIVFLFAQFWPLFAAFMILGAFSYFGTWITSSIALSKINNSPDKYKGKGKAMAALIIVAAYTVLVLAALVLLIIAAGF